MGFIIASAIFVLCVVIPYPLLSLGYFYACFPTVAVLMTTYWCAQRSRYRLMANMAVAARLKYETLSALMMSGGFLTIRRIMLTVTFFASCCFPGYYTVVVGVVWAKTHYALVESWCTPIVGAIKWYIPTGFWGDVIRYCAKRCSDVVTKVAIKVQMKSLNFIIDHIELIAILSIAAAVRKALIVRKTADQLEAKGEMSFWNIFKHGLTVAVVVSTAGSATLTGLSHTVTSISVLVEEAKSIVNVIEHIFNVTSEDIDPFQFAEHLAKAKKVSAKVAIFFVAVTLGVVGYLYYIGKVDLVPFKIPGFMKNWSSKQNDAPVVEANYKRRNFICYDDTKFDRLEKFVDGKWVDVDAASMRRMMTAYRRGTAAHGLDQGLFRMWNNNTCDEWMNVHDAHDPTYNPQTESKLKDNVVATVPTEREVSAIQIADVSTAVKAVVASEMKQATADLKRDWAAAGNNVRKAKKVAQKFKFATKQYAKKMATAVTTGNDELINQANLEKVTVTHAGFTSQVKTQKPMKPTIPPFVPTKRLESLVKAAPTVLHSKVGPCVLELLGDNDLVLSYGVNTFVGFLTNNHAIQLTKKLRVPGSKLTFTVPANKNVKFSNTDIVLLEPVAGCALLKKKNFAMPALDQAVVRYNTDNVSSGIVVSLGEHGAFGSQARASYSSQAGDCGSVVLNSNTEVVGIHFSAGAKDRDNLFWPVDAEFIQLFSPVTSKN